MSRLRGLWPPPPSWVRGFAVATLFSQLVASQRYLTLISAGDRTAWWTLLLSEMPVWYSWLLLTPGIRFVCRTFPLDGERRWRNAVVHSLAALLAGFLSVLAVLAFASLVWSLRPIEGPFWEAVFGAFRRRFDLFVLIYASIATFHHAVAAERALQEQALRQSQLEASAAHARLEGLEAQLQPHFLFNTLHGISALMARDVPAARRMVTRLSDLLRMSLEQRGDHEVPLGDEIATLSAYVDIQRMRFGERLAVEVDVESATSELLVPRLVLQPLVENAIRHGVERWASGGRITVVARRVGDGGVGERLRLEVRDDGPGLLAASSRRLGHGVGLANTRARLRALYGDDHVFRLTGGEGRGTVVELEIPARRREKATVAVEATPFPARLAPQEGAAA